MKIRILFVSIICAAATTLGVQAQEKAKTTPTETELETKMDDINTAYRRLNRQVSDATKNADSLKQIATIQQTAAAAMKLEPAKKKDLPAADQAKFVADYQAQMKEFVAHVGKVETALKAGKNDEAAELLKTLKQDQEEGHKQFKKDKKKGAPAKAGTAPKTEEKK